MISYRNLFAAAALVAGTSLGVTAASTATATAAPLPNYMCSGGSFGSPSIVPSGVYQSLTIAQDAVCATDSAPGVVAVYGLVKLMPDSAFDAGETDTAKLWVQNNVVVGADALLNIGCGGPDAGDSASAAVVSSTPSDCTADYLNGALLATGARGVIMHGVQVRGDVSVQGGGGGVNCDFFSEDVPPNFTAIEDNTINGAVNVSNLQSCWLGIIRNHVRGNIVDQNNTFFDDDANEVTDNVSNNQILCSANSPAAQFGDSEGGPNTARGGGHGECAPPLTTT